MCDFKYLKKKIKRLKCLVWGLQSPHQITPVIDSILHSRYHTAEPCEIIAFALICLHRSTAAPTSSSSSLCCCSCSLSSPTSKYRRPRAGRSTRSLPDSVRRPPPDGRSTRQMSSTALELTLSSERLPDNSEQTLAKTEEERDWEGSTNNTDRSFSRMIFTLSSHFGHHYQT